MKNKAISCNNRSYIQELKTKQIKKIQQLQFYKFVFLI